MKVVFCRFGAKKSRDAWSVSRIIIAVVVVSSKSHASRARAKKQNGDAHKPGGGCCGHFALQYKREKIFFSPLAADSANKPRLWWVLLPPRTSSLSSIVPSPPKKNNTAPKNTAATKKSAPPPPRGVLLRRTSKSASSIRFFFCGGLSCRPLCGARSFSFPSSSTKAARTKRRPRRPPQKEPGSGRDAIISIVVVVSLRAGRRPLTKLCGVFCKSATPTKDFYGVFLERKKRKKGKKDCVWSTKKRGDI